jgi:hypothetical protein
MKNIISIILSLLFTTVNCFGQTVNQLSDQEFENITINSVTIGEIMQTEGDASKMPQTLGKPQDIQKQRSNKAPASTHIDYEGFSIGFSETLNAKGNLSRIEVSKSDVILNIAREEFFLGKDISTVLKKFKINNQPNGENSLLFSPKYDSTIVFVVAFDDENIVTEIVYFVLT